MPNNFAQNAARGTRLDSFFAPLFFAAIALLAAGPALFSGGRLVCGGNNPDTWNHLWTFWRAGHALAGNDLGFMRSHLLTYPGWILEPMSVFDPLLPLLAAPLRAAFGLVSAYNVLVFLGLAFTAWSGFLLAAKLCGSRGAGLLAGAIIAANPFLYRQLAGGYAEYAWWGWVPLSTWLLLESVERPGARRVALYAASLALAALTSLFCAACAALAGACILAAEAARAALGLPNRLRRALKILAIAALCVSPMLLFWGLQVRALRAEGMDISGASPLEELMRGPAPARETPNTLPPLQDPSPAYLAWRSLRGTLDLGDLFSLRRGVTSAPARLSVGSKPLPAHWPWMNERRVEMALLLEWLPVLALCLLAWKPARFRNSNAGWLAMALFAFILALGRFPVWRGNMFDSIVLPYGWLGAVVPGFARLFGVPGRIFLVSVMAMSILAGRGWLALAGRLGAGAGQRAASAAAALALYAWFTLMGWGPGNRLATEAHVPPVYSAIAASGRRAAVLELPVAGDVDRYMLYQTAHGMPFFRGAPAVFPVKVHDEQGIRSNALVVAFEAYPVRFSGNAADYSDAVNKLEKSGFGYIMLHRDKNRPALFDEALEAMRAILGEPWAAEEHTVAWTIGGVLEQARDRKDARVIHRP